jgi:alpha-galactosidase
MDLSQYTYVFKEETMRVFQTREVEVMLTDEKFAELETKYAHYLQTMKAYNHSPLDFGTWASWELDHDKKGTPPLLR